MIQLTTPRFVRATRKSIERAVTEFTSRSSSSTVSINVLRSSFTYLSHLSQMYCYPSFRTRETTFHHTFPCGSRSHCNYPSICISSSPSQSCTLFWPLSFFLNFTLQRTMPCPFFIFVYGSPEKIWDMLSLGQTPRNRWKAERETRRGGSFANSQHGGPLNWHTRARDR